jgi:hypothetical protein
MGDLLKDLLSGNINKQIFAIEQYGCWKPKTTEERDTFIRSVLNIFENSPYRFAIADRLPFLGLEIVPYLEQLLKKSEDREVKLLCALVLLKNDNHLGNNLLLEELSCGGEYRFLAAMLLVKRRIPGTARAIEKYLENIEITPRKDLPDYVCSEIECILDYFKELNCKLSENLANRLGEAGYFVPESGARGGGSC